MDQRCASRTTTPCCYVTWRSHVLARSKQCDFHFSRRNRKDKVLSKLKMVPCRDFIHNGSIISFEQTRITDLDAAPGSPFEAKSTLDPPGTQNEP